MLENINKLVKTSDLNTLTKAKDSILDRLLEIQGGYVSSKRIGKEERSILKDCMKKINKRITELTAPKDSK
jgi:hypothetical protein